MYDTTKNKIAVLLSAVFIFILSIALCGMVLATSLQVYDRDEYKITRYWQGLYNNDWSNWQINYSLNMSETHDNLYQYTQKTGKGGYFKSGEITKQPLYIWFIYNDGKLSEPLLIYSSGSRKYDLFNVEVIKKTTVPVFPEKVDKVFMWDGDINDLLKYLKYRGVLPYNTSLKQRITPDMLNWNNL